MASQIPSANSKKSSKPSKLKVQIIEIELADGTVAVYSGLVQIDPPEIIQEPGYIIDIRVFPGVELAGGKAIELEKL